VVTLTSTTTYTITACPATVMNCPLGRVVTTTYTTTTVLGGPNPTPAGGAGGAAGPAGVAGGDAGYKPAVTPAPAGPIPTARPTSGFVTAGAGHLDAVGGALFGGVVAFAALL
jgi:hypothetical protein